MNRRYLAAAVAGLPVVFVALLQLPPAVIVALLVADVAIAAAVVARQSARPTRAAPVARRPPPRRYFDPVTGEVFNADQAPIGWNRPPPSPPPAAAQHSPIAAAPGAGHVHRPLVARQAEAEQRVELDVERVRTERTVHVRAGLGDALRQALGVEADG